jgi:dienelactone hydrolase
MEQAMREDVAFDADGVTLRGCFHRPAGPGPHPVLVLSHGFSALRSMGLDRYAEVLAAAGFACLVYDHRNLGTSDGEPRREIDPWRQILDTRHAISFARSRPGVDRDRVGLWGTSYAGGHALVVAAIDRRVKCVVFQAGTIDGYTAALGRAGADGIAALRRRVDADFEARAAGAPPVYVPVAEPGSDSYAYLVEAWPDSGYVNSVTLRSRDLALAYNPGAFIERIAPTPLLMIVAKSDKQTPSDLQRAAFARAGEPKKLVVISNAQHYDVYTTRFAETSTAARDWFAAHLR